MWFELRENLYSSFLAWWPFKLFSNWFFSSNNNYNKKNNNNNNRSNKHYNNWVTLLCQFYLRYLMSLYVAAKWVKKYFLKLNGYLQKAGNLRVWEMHSEPSETSKMDFPKVAVTCFHKNICVIPANIYIFIKVDYRNTMSKVWNKLKIFLTYC